MPILEIVGGIVALALGLFWGLGWARPERGGADEVHEERLFRTEGKRRRVKRHFTPLDLLSTRERPSERKRGLLR